MALSPAEDLHPPWIAALQKKSEPAQPAQSFLVNKLTTSSSIGDRDFIWFHYVSLSCWRKRSNGQDYKNPCHLWLFAKYLMVVWLFFYLLPSTGALNSFWNRSSQPPTQIKKSNNHVSPRSLLCPTKSGSIQPGMQWKQANSCSCACPTYFYCRMISFLMDQLFVYKYIRYQSRWRTS